MPLRLLLSRVRRAIGGTQLSAARMIAVLPCNGVHFQMNQPKPSHQGIAGSISLTEISGMSERISMFIRLFSIALR